MIRLPLYPVEPLSAAEQTAAEPLTSECTKCPRHGKAKTVCMRAGCAGTGQPGGLYVITARPSAVDDNAGRAASGQAGAYLKHQIGRWWSGPVVLDHAVRCGAGDSTEKEITACRPYTSRVLLDVRPSLIVALGSEAVFSVLGQWPPILSTSRGYGFTHSAVGDPVPVVFLPSVAAAQRNRFVKRDFEADLEWALTCGATLTPRFDVSTSVVQTHADALTVRDCILQEPWLAWDTETHGRFHRADFRVVSVTIGGPSGLYATWDEAYVRDTSTWDVLAEILGAADAPPRVAHNGKYDDRAWACGAGRRGASQFPQWTDRIQGDTRLFRRLIAAKADAHLATVSCLAGLGGHKDEATEATDRVCAALKQLASPPKRPKPSVLAVPDTVVAQVRAGLDPKAFAFGYIDPEVRARYNARDVHATAHVFQMLDKQLAQMPEHRQHWEEVMASADLAFRAVEHWGFAVDRCAIEASRQFLVSKRDEAMGRLRAYGDINPASPKQVGDLLFHRIGLIARKHTDSGAASTDKGVLEQLQHKHPAVKAIIDWRHFDTLRKFTDGWLPLIADDGRIHPSFNVDGAGSGRTSSSDPNLQNVPVRTEEGTMLRRCFTGSSADHLVLSVDYSQLELRIAAMLSGDQAMIDLFVRGADFHQATVDMIAPKVWGMTPQQVAALPKPQRDDMRRRAKTVNFAIWYGKSAAQLAKELGITTSEADAIVTQVMVRFPRATEWRREQVSSCRREGGVWSWWGGHRARFVPLYGIADPDDGMRVHSENAAVNSPVQGSAGFFCPASAQPLVRWIQDSGVDAKLVALVHDELVFDVHKDAIMLVARKAREVMLSHYSGDIPLTVDFKAGPTWGDCEALEVR